MAAYIQISPESYAKLLESASNADATVTDVLADAIDDLYRKRFIDECNRAAVTCVSAPADSLP